MVKKRVALALSGGVDSSTAAFLLKEAGYDVTGIHMRLWHGSEAVSNVEDNGRDYKRIISDIEQFCHSLGISFYVLDLESEFERYVIDYFCREYAQGRTPNPCIACNQYMKFGFLLQKVFSMGLDYLATGHYARVEYSDNAYHLLKVVDSDKDQSYVLYTLDQERLGHIIFPLGDYSKAEVRSIAQQKSIPAANKPSSQDICFITGSYGDFLSQKVPTISGDIVDSQGEVLGRHKGVVFYTVGQRHGLGIAADRRLYVTKIEPEKNRIVVGAEEELYRSELIASRLNWVSGRQPSEPLDVTVKIRYRSPEVAAILYPKIDSAGIQFRQPQRAITPGQAVVFYRGYEVIGGGIIGNQA